MTRPIRKNEIHARRVRREQLKKLRVRYAKVKTAAEKEKILAKVARVAPTITADQFVAPLKAS